MKLLLDSHALLWWLEDRPTLSREAFEAIEPGENEVFVSIASAWEMAIKIGRGRLIVRGDLQESIEESHLTLLAITLDHALEAGSLPPHHGDPFDRMLIAQAKIEGLTIVSRDPRFQPYGVPIIKA